MAQKQMQKDPYVQTVKELPRVNEFYNDKATGAIKTANGYLSALVKLNHYLERNHKENCNSIIDRLTKKDFDVYSLLRQYIAYLPTVVNGITSNTIGNYVAGVRSYFEFNDIDTHRFKHKVRLPKASKKKKTPIDKSDIRKLLNSCHIPRLKAYLLVLATSGMRDTSDACTVRNCDVDDSSSPTKIHVREEYAKTHTERDVFISDEATNFLNQFKDRTIRASEPDSLLFSSYKTSKRQGVTQEANTKRMAHNLYVRLNTDFHELLKTVSMDQREEYGQVGRRRHKITLHSLRRFASTTLENEIGQGYHDFILGHAANSNSVYYTQKEEKIRQDYLKVMPYLTFLDFTALEIKSKDIDTRMQDKDTQIAELNKQLQELRQRTTEYMSDTDVMLKQLVGFAAKDIEKKGDKPGQIYEATYRPASFDIRKTRK